MAEPTAPSTTKGARIVGDQRTALRGELAGRYADGESIRAIAADLGRSYGWVQTVLKEAGVELRSRGGDTRSAAARANRPEAVPAGSRSPLPARPAKPRSEELAEAGKPQRRPVKPVAERVDGIEAPVPEPETAKPAPKKKQKKSDAKKPDEKKPDEKKNDSGKPAEKKSDKKAQAAPEQKKAKKAKKSKSKDKSSRK